MSKLFNFDKRTPFVWKNIKTYLVRSQYNELLKLVTHEYFQKQFKSTTLPNFLNRNLCLTLVNEENCSCNYTHNSNGKIQIDDEVVNAKTELDNVQSKLMIKLVDDDALFLKWQQFYDLLKKDKDNLSFLQPSADKLLNITEPKWENSSHVFLLGDILFRFKAEEAGKQEKKDKKNNELKKAQNELAKVQEEEEEKALQKYDNAKEALAANTSDAGLQAAEKKAKKDYEDISKKRADKEKEVNTKQTEFDNLPNAKNIELARQYNVLFSDISEYMTQYDVYSTKLNSSQKSLVDALKNEKKAKINLDQAEKVYENDDSIDNKISRDKAKIDFEGAIVARQEMEMQYGKVSNDDCKDIENNTTCAPIFNYIRDTKLPDTAKLPINMALNINGLTVGSVLWLYFYERMGIFKIMGVLLDDYNYKGKYTISGSRSNEYSVLMDTFSTLGRVGISSLQRDRITTYQRVLGIQISGTNFDTEQNKGFMHSFNKLLDHMLEFYKAKQLASAIQNVSGRSSVATQTSIRDTIVSLKSQFEPLEYGRNQINTFLGIASVHATICLVNLLRKEIGIPDQYNEPHEFIPAAYEILVLKRPSTLSSTNRYIVYDNCASYGFRILTDVEAIDINQIQAIAEGSDLDKWLNSVEGWVEGYRNAFASLPESVEAIL